MHLIKPFQLLNILINSWAYLVKLSKIIVIFLLLLYGSPVKVCFQLLDVCVSSHNMSLFFLCVAKITKISFVLHL